MRETNCIWRQSWIDECRVDAAPALKRTIVAIDPPAIGHHPSGIIVAGIGDDQVAYILREFPTDLDMLRHILDAVTLVHETGADRIVAEWHRSAEPITYLVRQITDTPCDLCKMKGGRWIRSETVAAAYAEGRVKHVGRLPRLEYEMTLLGDHLVRDFRMINAMLVAVHHLLMRQQQPSLRAV